MLRIEGLAAPLCTALSAYNNVRKGVAVFVEDALDMEEDTFRDLLRCGQNFGDPERALVMELGKLGACESDLRLVADELGKVGAPESEGGLALERDEDFLRRLDEDMAAVELVTPPMSNERISMFQMDLQQLIEDAPEHPTEVATCLVEMRQNMETMMGLQHTRNQLDIKSVKANEHRLRDELFVSRRKLVALTQQIKVFEDMGLVAATKEEVELSRDDALQEFSLAKAQIKSLEAEVDSLKEAESKLTAKLEKVTQGYRSKNLEVLTRKQENNALVEKLTQRTSELLQKDTEATALREEREECREVMCAAFPALDNANYSYADILRGAAAGVNSIRSFVRALRAETPVSEIPPQLVHNHALTSEVLQLCTVLSGASGAPGGGAPKAPAASNVLKATTFARRATRAFRRKKSVMPASTASSLAPSPSPSPCASPTPVVGESPEGSPCIPKGSPTSPAEGQTDFLRESSFFAGLARETSRECFP